MQGMIYVSLLQPGSAAEDLLRHVQSTRNEDQAWRKFPPAAAVAAGADRTNLDVQDLCMCELLARDLVWGKCSGCTDLAYLLSSYEHVSNCCQACSRPIAVADLASLAEHC